MKVRAFTLFTAVLFTLALLFTAAVPGVPATPAPSPAPAAVPQRHPEIHAAIDSLRHAREHLEHAAHDYHGHRDAAIHAIDGAIEQLEVCLKYD